VSWFRVGAAGEKSLSLDIMEELAKEPLPLLLNIISDPDPSKPSFSISLASEN